MNKIENEFWKNAQAKEMAIKFFPSFFGEDLNVTTKYNIKDLENEYLKYCVKYFTIYANDSANERFYIQMAYEYMKTFLTEHTKFEMNFQIAKDVLKSYQDLIYILSGYHFFPHWKNSYGALQNDTNKKILFEISLFNPFLTKVLRNIDKYFKNVPEPGKIDEFYCELIAKLECLKKLLEDSFEDLSNAQREYHKTWNAANRSFDYVPNREVGFAKKDWRLMRNETCHSILNFFKELENINIALYYGTFNYNVLNAGVDAVTLEVSELYNNCVKNIINGPNYFCYLNETEKEEIAQEKLIRKIDSKMHL